MTNLEYELKNMTYRHRDGSFQTRATRRTDLRVIARELNELGFKYLSAHSLKPKHVLALVEYWQERGLSVGTQQRYVVSLRWWAEKVCKSDVIPASNAALGIGSRSFVALNSASLYLSEMQLCEVPHDWLRLALRLQQEFGLRREEALKFRPDYALRDDRIELMRSWCKGGRARTVPIWTPQQALLLDDIRSFNTEGSLVPSAKSYKQGVNIYEY